MLGVGAGHHHALHNAVSVEAVVCMRQLIAHSWYMRDCSVRCHVASIAIKMF